MGFHAVGFYLIRYHHGVVTISTSDIIGYNMRSYMGCQKHFDGEELERVVHSLHLC